MDRFEKEARKIRQWFHLHIEGSVADCIALEEMIAKALRKASEEGYRNGLDQGRTSGFDTFSRG